MAKHIYHYNTHAEKRYFLGPEHRDLYDIVALNGNIVSHSPLGTAGFIATAGKNFYIDPQTHAFQHPTIHLKRDVSDKDKGEPQRYEFKPSIVKLATERLGNIFSDVITNDRPLSPSVFINNGSINNDIVNSICQNIIDFQLNTMINEIDDEAREFIGDYPNLKPLFVIAPYFYLSSHTWNDWLKINIACYRRAKELTTDLPVYLGMVMSKEALNHSEVIGDAIAEINPDGILLWIDEHIEEELDTLGANRYLHFLQKLRDTTDTIYNVHAGFLSLLLCHSDIGNLLNGVGHSVNYGEHRPVVPIGGGLPMAHFYFMPVHSRLRWGDAAGIVHAKGWLRTTELYRLNVCMCRQCQKLLDEKGSAEETFSAYGESNPITFTRRSGTIVRLNYPTKAAKQAAACHYLYNKKKEFDDLGNYSITQILDQLVENYDDISADLGEGPVSHLVSWKNAIDSLIS